MEQILNTLVPVFLLIGLGYLLARKGLLSDPVLVELNRVLYWIALPALIVHSLATTESIPSGTLPIVIVFLVATVLVALAAFPVSWLLKLERKKLGTFIQAGFRGNLGYTGLPLVYYAFQGEGSGAVSAAIAQGVFILAPAMLLYNTLAVFLLLGSHEKSFMHNFPQTALKVIRNPLILASGFGVLLFLLPFPKPQFFLNTLELTGQMAAPVSLLCVGGGMAFVSMEGRYRSATAASLLKVLLLPLTAYCLTLTLSLDSASQRVLLIFSACPTAVTSYIMAKELKGDSALAAGGIVISTTLSAIALAVVLAVF